MKDLICEFAVFGTTPMAGLLAGLLASAHNRRVCLIGNPMSAYRLARGIDLSVGPVTRPQTWAMLRQVGPESVKLITRIGGRAAIRRLDPLLVAETERSIAGLGHIAHMARGFGQAVERVNEFGVPEKALGYSFRDAAIIERSAFEPRLETWLTHANVERLHRRGLEIALRRDGSALITGTTRTIEARQVIFADDAAILEHLTLEERDKVLRIENTTALLSEPGPRLGMPMQFYLDRGVILNQRASRAIAVLCAAPPVKAQALIGSCLKGNGPLRAAGHAAFQTLGTVDGGPVVGMLRGRKALVLAGFGLIGAFLTPALARFVVGEASVEEAAYFSARAAERRGGRGNGRANVAEYQSAFAPEDVS